MKEETCSLCHKNCHWNESINNKTSIVMYSADKHCPYQCFVIENQKWTRWLLNNGKNFSSKIFEFKIKVISLWFTERIIFSNTSPSMKIILQVQKTSWKKFLLWNKLLDSRTIITGDFNDSLCLTFLNLRIKTINQVITYSQLINCCHKAAPFISQAAQVGTFGELWRQYIWLLNQELNLQFTAIKSV